MYFEIGTVIFWIIVIADPILCAIMYYNDPESEIAFWAFVYVVFAGIMIVIWLPVLGFVILFYGTLFVLGKFR